MAGGSSQAAPSPAYIVYVPVRFLVVTLVGSVFLAFAVGQAARLFVTGGYEQIPFVEVEEEKGILPHPVMQNGKKVPRTVYTSKHYDTGKSVTSDSLLARQELQSANKEWVECIDSEGGGKICHNEEHPSDPSIEQNEEEEESEHEPAGQHLLVDIENLEGAFLNSKERLARAMMDLVDLSGLTMLSYHCHELEPAGVSCAGVLLESHVSFHTWPAEGVITLDLFTCGPASLVPYIPVVQRLFSIGKSPTFEGEEVEPPHMLWSYKRRGFRNEEVYDAAGGDMYNYLLGVMEFENKTQIAAVKTDFQDVEIFDLIHPRFRTVEQYQKSISNDGSYESKHPELFLPDRIVYLDGVMQSRRYGEAAYHESLVHPAMFANPNPEYVAIIGGGEGATLREVLKHDTLKQVIMIEIDKGMVDMSKKYLPDWNYCGNIAGSTESCFDDPRATVYYQDAIQWFIDHYSPGKESGKEPKLDVIIMDALDPGNNVDFSDLLFDNEAFAKALHNSLNDGGVFIAQTGEAANLEDPSKMNSRERYEFIFKTRLAEAGFQTMKEYEDAHGGFNGVWSFFAAFVNSSTKSRWHANEAEINLAIRKRMRSTTAGKSPLVYFDGATMQSYQYPSKAAEVVFCRTVPDAFGCNRTHGIDPRIYDVPTSDLEVKASLVDSAKHGVFAKVDIVEGSYLAIKEQTRDIFIPPSTYELIYNFTQHPAGYQHSFFTSFLKGYGCGHHYFGGVGRSVDPGLLAFTNHGCNSNYNLGPMQDVNEMNADENSLPERSPLDWETAVNNPFIDRNVRVLMHSLGYANRDIPAGTEIQDNLLNYAGTLEQWKNTVLDLRAQCSTEEEVVVSE
ncbi:Polyamine aminopropyltransferase [Seminavis robusta]|uniref:Polyamine aminopropyltransferase n=1 Tax=Seminavis robusta TaxID=568900 RepID=A0A9N8DW04_9STRA|nr:Polyamine aminopropyltransferase [Seminavis robusta]|eukprot:Sro323_g117250.1 Polyamine aminopropyltransferase (845) ;mRNA; f:14431-17321